MSDAKAASAQGGETQAGDTAGSGAGAWMRERFPVDPNSIKSGRNEAIPDHLKSYWYCLGGTPAFLLIVQVITGILLTFHYRADSAQAYESVRRITEDIPYGWWVRSIHHWSSHLMVLAVLVHMVRVFVTGAYRKPREFSWLIGCGLLFIVFMMGFTGYSLIRDQRTFWGVNVASQLAAQTPVIGNWLSMMLLGGAENAGATGSRLFVFHIGVLPTLMALLLVAHLSLIRLHGVADVRRLETGVKTKTYPFFPDHFVTEIIMALSITVLLMGLALIFPAELRQAADPTTTPAHVKPEWYLFFTFRTLKLMGLTAAMIAMGAFGFFVAFWPFIDGRIRKSKPGSEISVWIGSAVVLILIWLTLWEAFD